MKKILMMASVILGMSITSAYAQYAAPGSCNPRPTYAYNGKIRIKYPKNTTSETFLRQVCNAETVAAAKQLMAEAKAKGVTLKWIEFYETRGWTATFEDQTRELKNHGFKWGKYKSWEKVNDYPTSATLMYINESTGKFVARLHGGNYKQARYILMGN